MKSQETKKKLLYVITQGEWGGAQRYIYDLAIGLDTDFAITVAIGEPNGSKELQKKLRTVDCGSQVNIVQLKHLMRKISPIHDILAVFELFKLYKKLKPEIVHLNSTKAGIVGSIAKLLAGNSKLPIGIYKLIYTVHGWVFEEPLSFFTNQLYKFLERATAKIKDGIIVLSENDRVAGLKLGINEAKLHKIPLGVNLPELMNKEEAKKQLAVATNDQIVNSSFLIATIANLYPTKGLNTLIEAIAKIKESKNIENTKFVIIGEGEDRNNLQRLISDRDLQKTIFLAGAVENAARYLPAFDLFVLPSQKEGLPYAIMEAMAAGIPIITTNVGGIPSLVDDTNGLSINANNAVQLANSIIWARENPNEMKKRAERAGEKIKNFTLKKMLTETKAIYQ